MEAEKIFEQLNLCAKLMLLVSWESCICIYITKLFKSGTYVKYIIIFMLGGCGGGGGWKVEAIQLFSLFVVPDWSHQALSDRNIMETADWRPIWNSVRLTYLWRNVFYVSKAHNQKFFLKWIYNFSKIVIERKINVNNMKIALIGNGNEGNGNVTCVFCGTNSRSVPG